MTLLITELEVLAQVTHAVRLVASRLRIRDCDWLAISELLPLINEIDPQAHQLLGDYITAFRGWYAFHHEREKVGKQGFLDDQETADLVKRVTLKDSTRENLAAYVKTLS
jgi:hypothetical protein